ncbi:MULTISPECIES: hypothetical protein [Rheinheimera]|jgi:hypothetical protein|nr:MULTISPECIES: hypothetical protein [Rheinheimera]CAI3792888.1 hypothetical protein JAMGFMIE_00673 [Rheinheimera sp. MM224]HJS14390.1 hypothetical protein [Rheinheimera sp.]
MLSLTLGLLGLFLLPVVSVGLVSVIWHWLLPPFDIPGSTRF